MKEERKRRGGRRGGRRKNWKSRRRVELLKTLSYREKQIAKLDGLARGLDHSNDLEFANSLLHQFRTQGTLSDKQWWWVQQLATKLQKKSNQTPSKTKRYKVYMIRAGDYIKIGYSHDPDARLKSMETGNPLSMEIIWQQDMGPVARTAKLAESRLHTRFEKHRHKGEWFHAEPVIALLQESYEDMVPDYDELNLVYRAQQRI